MMKVLDEGTFACGIFTDLQGQLILLITTYYQKNRLLWLPRKIDHYGIKGISNK